MDWCRAPTRAGWARSFFFCTSLENLRDLYLRQLLMLLSAERQIGPVPFRLIWMKPENKSLRVVRRKGSSLRRTPRAPC